MTQLAATGEIAELLGVSRQRVQQLAARDDFPKPVGTLGTGRIWKHDDVLAWARATGRITEDKAGEEAP